MDYQILPMGSIWQDGSFFVPASICSRYIKMASEYQLKALLIILSDNGKASSRDIAKILGCTEADADDFLDFWVEEGVLSKDSVVVVRQDVSEKENTPVKKEVEEKPKKRMASVSVPTLSPKEIVAVCNNDNVLSNLMRSAQEVLGKTLSHTEQELIVNMVNYYGLPPAIVLTILQYYKTQKEKGMALGTAYIATVAKNWSEEGITTLDAADEKLRDIENSNRLWREIISLTGIRHRSPTAKQRDMIKQWADDFSMEMIALACDAMKENAEKPSLQYVNSILKNWKKKGIKTPDDVNAERESFSKSKSQDKTAHIDSTYDIDSIADKAMQNDNYDV